MHKRTLIRDFLVAYLKSDTVNIVPNFEDRVYSGRIKPFQDKENGSNYPFITIFTRNEDIIEHYTSNTKRELTVNIGVATISNTTDNLDSVTEEALFNIEKSMSKLYRANAVGDDPYALIDEIYLESVNIDSESDGKNSIGKAMLTYKVEYEYQRPVDFDINSLVDFDEIGSIANLIITNDGVHRNV